MTPINLQYSGFRFNGKSFSQSAKRFQRYVGLLLFSIIAFHSSSYAQVDLTKCYGSCTAGDFTITKAYLTDVNGVPITSAACNNPDAIVPAYITFVFTNTTNSDRNGIFVSGDVNGVHIFQCFPGVVSKKQSVTKTVTTSVNWVCGTDLTLQNTFVSWGSGGEAICSITCKDVTPSKCRTVGDVLIQTPLSGNFTFTKACETGKNFETVSFKATASGGDHNFTYSWNFGDGTAATSFSATTTATHTYASAGNFDVTLTVKDGTGTTKSATKSVTVIACCTSPTVSTQPSATTKCDGASASFTAASTGGSPAPTVQWQVSTDNGGTWTNLVNGSPYSGVTTGTLTVNPASTSLNNNLYRAVFTSGSCPSTNSNGAKLTVNPIPGKPSLSNNGPICEGATLNLSTTAVSGATYSWTGPNNFTSALQNPTITNATTAASGVYKLTVTVLGCTSPEGTTTATVNAIPSKPLINTPTQPTCSAPTGSFTVQNPDNTVTYTLTGPNPATTTQSNSTGSFSNLAAGTYGLTASKNGCTSASTTVTINAALGAPKAPVISISKSPDCTSATGTVKIDNLADYGTGFEFSSDGTTWVSTTTFDFTAGEGIRVYVRRTSDHTCTSNSACGNPAAGLVGKTQLAQPKTTVTSETKVIAAPNPFNDKIRFSITPGASGRGSLDLYNLLGQKVRTVFEGQVQKGQVETIEYSVPNSQRTNLIYFFRVGTDRASGKLINLK